MPASGQLLVCSSCQQYNVTRVAGRPGAAGGGQRVPDQQPWGETSWLWAGGCSM
jgi:hypothetical protein